MKVLYLFLALQCVAASIFAQDISNIQNLVSSNPRLRSYDAEDKSIVGSPYIQDSFKSAKVSAQTDEIFSLRYNAFMDEMEIESDQKNNPTINKSIPGLKITFANENKTYQSTSFFEENGNLSTGFLVKITNDNLTKVSLFAREKIKFYEMRPATSSYSENKPAKFDRMDDSYYMSIDNEIAKPLSTNKKDIAALFPQHEKEILKYIGSEKINVKKQDDLINLFVYINQLAK